LARLGFAKIRGSKNVVLYDNANNSIIMIDQMQSITRAFLSPTTIMLISI